MRGARPLTKKEVLQVKAIFKGRNADRNRCLFLLGINTGFRISELLSLKVCDILEHDGTIRERVTVRKCEMKGKREGRTVLLNDATREMLESYVDGMDINDYLFTSEQGGQLTRYGAHKILKRCFKLAKLRGPLSTHSLRKTFANSVFDGAEGLRQHGHNIDPFRMTSKALGHVSLNSTDKYLSFRQADLDQIIQEIGK
jgi:integrase